MRPKDFDLPTHWLMALEPDLNGSGHLAFTRPPPFGRLAARCPQAASAVSSTPMSARTPARPAPTRFMTVANATKSIGLFR